MFDSIIDFVANNPLKCFVAVAATVTTGGICWVGAPAIAATLGATGFLGAASTGTAISTLSGAALTNASLAALGGGALAAGGAGMAGGTVTVTTVGSVIGGVVSTTVVAKNS